MKKTSSVLFVCMGNICRSPAGEGIMQALVESRGLGAKVKVDSAGTIGYHTGNPADPRMRRAAESRGYDLTSRARQVTPHDLMAFDLIVAMDRENLNDLTALRGAGQARILLLSEFLEGDWPRDVPDPYYGGIDGFEVVLDMIEGACPKIIDELMGESP